MDNIYWKNGMQLTQHTFQYSDLLAQKKLHLSNQLLSRGLWGFNQLDISKKSLKNGVFQLNAFELILPNGEVRKYASEIDPYDCILNGKVSPGIVYLIFTKHDNQLNVKDIEITPNQTYINDITATDQYNHRCRKKIQISTKGCILSQRPYGKNFHNIPICKIIGKQEQSLTLDKTFIPPIIRIAAVPYLKNACQSIIKSIRKLCSLLKPIKDEYSLYYMLHMACSNLCYELNSYRSSPRVIMHMLQNIAICINPDHLIIGYDTNCINTSLNEIITKVKSLVSEYKIEGHEKLYYERIENNIYSIQGFNASNNYSSLYINIKSHLKMDNYELLRSQIKIDKKDKLQGKITHALPGISYNLVHMKHQGTYTYYQIILQITPTMFESLATEHQNSLCLYLPNDTWIQHLYLQENNHE